MSRVHVTQDPDAPADVLSRCREDIARLDAVLDALHSERTRLARLFEQIAGTPAVEPRSPGEPYAG